MFDLAGKRVWVAGHKGMVGSAIVRRLASEDCDVLTVDRTELDLTDQRGVLGWMHNNRPQVVFLAAARVGGIHANNTRPVDFLRDNLMISRMHAKLFFGMVLRLPLLLWRKVMR